MDSGPSLMFEYRSDSQLPNRRLLLFSGKPAFRPPVVYISFRCSEIATEKHLPLSVDLQHQAGAGLGAGLPSGIIS